MDKMSKFGLEKWVTINSIEVLFDLIFVCEYN